MLSHTASIPLTDALPWLSSPPSDGRCFLVNDSTETDGRFLLYSLTSQVLSSSNTDSRVLWISFLPTTERLIVNALKKMEFTVQASNSVRQQLASSQQDGSRSSRLRIRCVPGEIGEEHQEELSDDATMLEVYMKALFHDIQAWAADSSANWLILDDVSALGSLVGERLAYAFVLSVKTFSSNSGSFGIMLRCSQDFDQDLFLKERDANQIRPGGSGHVEWVAAGGRGDCRGSVGGIIPWERHLVELADGVVDVLPLASGYSREAHGRLVITSSPAGRGWGATSTGSPMVMNYVCHDNSVWGIRLRGPSTSI